MHDSTAEMTAAEVADADLRHVIHPFSLLAGRTREHLLIVERAHGLRLYDIDGNEYLDAKSGLVNVNVGWGREELGRVAGEATATLGYASLFFDHGHVPAAMLAQRLAGLTPGAIDRFLFTVGGSDANETALKLARMYHAARGEPRKTTVIARDSSYHGMSMGGTSMSGAAAYWAGIGPMLPGVVHIPQPDPADPRAAEVLDAAIRAAGPDTVAAFIAEPISNPAGVNVPHPGYWPAVREICDRHDVLLIADEVITGFGRTGRMFACEHWGLEPDVISLSKGLTSGYQPLGAAGFTSAIIDTIADATAPLLHGFTAGGHPAGCAVALATLDIMEREDLVANADRMGERLRDRLRAMSDRLQLGTVRGLGLLCALDLGASGGGATPASGTETPGGRVEALLRERRMLIRRYADTMILAPALTVTPQEVDEIADRLEAAIRDVLAA